MQDALFSKAYSGDRKPLSPSNFLATWWQHAGSLVGYQQQDAHEFFLFALSGLEGSKVVQTPTPSAASPSPGNKKDADIAFKGIGCQHNTGNP